MKRGLSYLPTQQVFPSLGLNVLEPSSQADPRTSPALNNYTLQKGLPQKRMGYWALGSALGSSILGLVEFESLAGVKTMLAICREHIYKLDTSTDPPTWTAITGAMNWTGDESDFLDVAIVTGLDSGGTYVKWIILSNGKSADDTVYWAGTGNFAAYAPDISGYTTHRTARMFFNRMVLANINTGTQQRQLIGWSAIQKLVDFTSEGAGEIIVPGVDGQFLRAETLGERLVLYSEESICVVAYVGGTAIFTIEKVTDESRLVSPRAIINLGPFHLFLTQENVSLFDGTRLLRTMGDRIYRQYRDELAVSRAYEAFAFHDSPKQQVHFVIPVNASDHAVYVLEYDLVDITSCKWTRHQYAGRPRAMGSWSRISTLTYDSNWAQTTPFNVATFPSNQGQTKKGFPVRVVGIGNTVYVADDTVSSDAGTAVTAYWETIDFVPDHGFPSEYARWLEIEVEAKGTQMTLYVSVDNGQNWTTVSTVTLDSAWKKYSFMIDQMGPVLRIKMENAQTGGAISHRLIRTWYRPGGPT